MSVEFAIGRRVRRLAHRLLTGTAWFAVFHPKSVLTFCGLTTALALYVASGIELSTDLEDLLPRNSPAARSLNDLYERYGGTEPIVVAISGVGEADLDDRIDLALGLSDRLREIEGLRVVAGPLGEDPWEILHSSLADALLLYLEPDQIDALARRLRPESIDATVAANIERLRSPLGPLTTRLIAEDPLGLMRQALHRLDSLRGRLQLESREGVLTSVDGAFVLVLVRLESRTHDYAIGRARLEQVAAAALDEMAALGLTGTAGVGPAPEGSTEIHVGLTGAPAILVDYRAILGLDIRKISSVAIVAVLILFLLAFRRPLGLLIAAVPLVVGMIWTLAFASISVGVISVFTAGSVAILSGLAIDITIHLYNRYLEEVHAGRDMLESFEAAHGETGIGIIAAALTTAWAFFAAGLSSFRGLRDLGIICGAGILLSLVASMLLVPAITALATRLSPGRDRPRGLTGFGLEPLLRQVVRHPRVVVALGLVAMLLLAWPMSRAHLDEDFRRFRPQTAPSIVLQDQIAGRIGASLQSVIALVPGDDPQQALEGAARVEESWQPLVVDDDGVLASVMGPGRVVPPLSFQQRALERLGELTAAGDVTPAVVERQLLEAMERHGFRVDERARATAARVRRMLERRRPLTIDEAREGPLGAVLEDLFIEDAAGRTQALVSAYPRRGVLSRNLVQAMREGLARSGATGELVGGRVLSEEIKPLIIRDGTRAIILSAAGILLILTLAFRRPLLVLLTFLPLVAGVIGSVGVMAVARIDFNLVSISMLPLILGIGIDNGIHVVHRFLHHVDEDLVEVFHHTGRGIVMTSLTTIVGFGALVFADYPGLISSGILAILGVGATLITAVTLLPALLQLVRVRDKKREA